MSEIWYVVGDTLRHLFSTKMAAEKYARVLFPDEDPDKRYARVMCRQVFDESDVEV